MGEPRKSCVSCVIVLSYLFAFVFSEIPVRILHISKQLYLRNAAYAWLKCEWEEDKDCSAVLRGANILGRNGSMFAAGNCYVRLSLLRTDDDFEFLLHRMNNLVSDEDGSKTM